MAIADVELAHLRERACCEPAPGFLFFEDFLPKKRADDLFVHCLNEIPWRIEIVPLFGKRFVAPRLSCGVGLEGATYRYRGSQSTAIRFTRELDNCRMYLQQELNARFNFALANLYRSGQDYVGWHSDDERDMGSAPVIASLSLGAVRRFRVRSKKSGMSESLDLQHGSLVVMYGESQRNYKHMLCKTAKQVSERVNLSFRQVSM